MISLFQKSASPQVALYQRSRSRRAGIPSQSIVVGLLARGLKQSEVRRGMSEVKPKPVEQLDSSRAQVRNMMINTTRFIIFTP